MRRPTDKQLFDAIELNLFGPTPATQISDILLYAQIRALDRLADNVHVLNDTLAVIRADHKPEPTELIEALKLADETLEDLRVPGGEGNRFEQAIPAALAKIRAALSDDAAADAERGRAAGGRG